MAKWSSERTVTSKLVAVVVLDSTLIFGFFTKPEDKIIIPYCDSDSNSNRSNNSNNNARNSLLLLS